MLEADVLIIGGGIAGLWTLDHLRRAGYRAWLLENRALGYGQTISSQGIIHGGLKYSLRGVLTPSANEIREMPLIWRDCLSGVREPNLSRTDVRSHRCYLWQTSAVASKAGMLGAQLNLRVKPQTVSADKRPDVLGKTPGVVYALDEQVLSPTSLLNCFRERNRNWMLQIDEEDGVEFQFYADDFIESAQIKSAGRSLEIRTKAVIMSAGAGNALLSEQAGKAQSMQRRPLHMVMCRGPLPTFQGHCIDGSKTRLTITSEIVSNTETVWQLGGSIAEKGVDQSPADLIRFAIQELRETLPGLNVKQLEFATYRIDRAERKVAFGMRPETPQLLRRHNAITCWPTKLAFAPRAAEHLEKMLASELKLSPTLEGAETTSSQLEWTVPDVAKSPWETAESWYQVDSNYQILNAVQDQAA